LDPNNQPSTTVRIFYYGLMLLMIDRTDEYQLLHFVRSFKSWHFLSTGVVGMVVGASLYIKCINLPGPTGAGDLDLYQEQMADAVAALAGTVNSTMTDTIQAALDGVSASVAAPPPQLQNYVAVPNLQACHEFGPGAFKLYFVEIICFFLNVVVVWWAFSLMKVSNQTPATARLSC
jgi:hypothetical protein